MVGTRRGGWSDTKNDGLGGVWGGGVGGLSGSATGTSDIGQRETLQEGGEGRVMKGGEKAGERNTRANDLMKISKTRNDQVGGGGVCAMKRFLRHGKNREKTG